MNRRSIAVLVALAVVSAGLVVRAHAGNGRASTATRAASAGSRGTHGIAQKPGISAPTEDGARRAAMRFATASQDWLYLSDDDLDRAVRAVAAPATAAQLSRETITELRVARDGLADAAGRVWWVVRPLATRVERLDHSSARVVVWTVTVLSAADVAIPQADWLRVAVDLVWTNGEWKLQALADMPGPTPATGTKDRPWQPEPFDEALAGFQRATSGTDR